MFVIGAALFGVLIVVVALAVVVVLAVAMFADSIRNLSARHGRK